jgi:hypothetical protein
MTPSSVKKVLNSGVTQSSKSEILHDAISMKEFLHNAIFCETSPTECSILDNKFQIVQSSEAEHSAVLCKKKFSKMNKYVQRVLCYRNSLQEIRYDSGYRKEHLAWYSNL